MSSVVSSGHPGITPRLRQPQMGHRMIFWECILCLTCFLSRDTMRQYPSEIFQAVFSWRFEQHFRDEVLVHGRVVCHRDHYKQYYRADPSFKVGSALRCALPPLWGPLSRWYSVNGSVLLLEGEVPAAVYAVGVEGEAGGRGDGGGP